MNLAELTDLELADKAIDEAERFTVRDVLGYPHVTAEGRLRLEALFRELRQAWRPAAARRWPPPSKERVFGIWDAR